MVDDYAFLPAVPENLPLVSKEEDFGVEFLKSEKQLAVVSWKDLEGMHGRTALALEAGDPIEVVRGSAEGLHGRVVRVEKTGIRVRLESYKRSYEREVGFLDVILVKP